MLCGILHCLLYRGLVVDPIRKGDQQVSVSYSGVKLQFSTLLSNFIDIVMNYKECVLDV